MFEERVTPYLAPWALVIVEQFCVQIRMQKEGESFKAYVPAASISWQNIAVLETAYQKPCRIDWYTVCGIRNKRVQQNVILTMILDI